MDRTYNTQLDAYLDGMLDEDERRALEANINHEAQLRAAKCQQEAINESLRRAFTPPHPEDCLAGIKGELSAAEISLQRIGRGVIGRRAAIAALLAIVAFGAWHTWVEWRGNAPRDLYAPQPWRGFATVYEDRLAGGFMPDWVCRDDRQFRRTFAKQLGQPLLLAPLPPDIQMGGLAYSNTVSPLTINVLMHVSGKPVIVFVDRKEKDSSIAAPPEGLHLFRGEIGDLVLYEMSPLDEPRVLSYFRQPAD